MRNEQVNAGMAWLALPALLVSAAPLFALDAEEVLESIDPGRITAMSSLGEGASSVDFLAGSLAESRFRIETGELLRVDLEDGSSRFLTPDSRFQEQELEGQPLLPRGSMFVEVPTHGEIHLVVESLQLSALDQVWPGVGRDEESVDCIPDAPRDLFSPDRADYRSSLTSSSFDLPLILGDPVIFRDVRMVAISLHPMILDAEGLKKVDQVEFRLEYGSTPADPGLLNLQSSAGNEKRGFRQPISSHMAGIYADLISNQGQFYNNVDDSVFPVYLITGSPDYLQNDGQYIADFVQWKRQKGFDVRIVPFDQIAGGGQTISFGSLRNWMQQQWTELRPEYLLLVGDDDGDAACPDSVVQSSQGEFDVSDHFYALQEGDDYFPELFVGRFSVDNLQQMVTMAMKSMIHEKLPNIAGSDWHTKGLVVSCNYSDSGNHPVSPNLTSRWVIDKLRANGFTLTAQDSIFYPPEAEGGSLINNALNQGRGVVSYRGWANSNGWIYPAYDRDDIDELNNAGRMPIVCSFVCQTGAYGAGSGDIQVEDPCFGEKFVRVGDPSTPIGAVAFVGPSDLHTRSQYNNPVCSGLFNALFDLDITSIGPALLNGKMELWRGYPLEREDPYGSYFYFHVYNVLGDPNLKFWRNNPRDVVVTVDTELRPGQNALAVQITDSQDDAPLDNVLVTLTAGTSLLARGTAMGGHVELIIDPETLASADGAFKLVTNHLDFVPKETTLHFQEDAYALELTGLSVTETLVDGQYLAGESLQLALNLSNNGVTDIPAGTAVLLPSPDGLYSIDNDTITLPAMATGANATTSESFSIQLAQDVPHGMELSFQVQSTLGETVLISAAELFASGPRLELQSLQYRSGAEMLSPLEADTLDLVIRNTGTVDVADVTWMLATEDARISIEQSEANPGALAVDAEVAVSFALRGGLGLFPGQAIQVELGLMDDGREVNTSLDLPSGTLETGNPLGPDAYGYYAIESEDYGVSGRPDYEWHELDPAYGGSGASRLYLTDDEVTQVELPFPMQFYGMSDNTISICSNGWIALGNTWMDNFRNWNLPSSLGPPNLVCAYWDDLKPMYTASNDSLYVPVFWRHDPDEGRVIVSWSRTYNRYAWENPGQPLQEFQLILYDQATRPTASGDTEIVVQYKDVTDLDQNNNFATVGLENFGHNVGLQVTYAAQPSEGCLPIGGGRAIRFTTSTPLHEDLVQVNLVSPVQNAWLNNVSPVFTWDHETFASQTGQSGISYNVSIQASDGSALVNETVVDSGVLDLSLRSIELPEAEALSFLLVATAGGNTYESLQGTVTFQIDATAPEATPGLLESVLFAGDLELGLLISESLSWLQVVAEDSDGNTLATFSQTEGAVAFGDGQELRYLRASLSAAMSQLRITGQDLHGLDMLSELPLQASDASSGRMDLPGLAAELAWSGSSSWLVAMGHHAEQSTGLLSEHDQLDLILPEDLHSCELLVDAPAGAVLVKKSGSTWQRVTQVHDGNRIEASISSSGRYALMDEGSAPEALPTEFRLAGNHPNPFNPETVIRFDLPEEGLVNLEIYNLRGQLVRVLKQDLMQAGSHALTWRGLNDSKQAVASGVYVARLGWNGKQGVHKMLLVR